MAIKMVREPSETPNINNIDDIIPMRYAYGGQNGYVIGKGTEISNSVNGLNFTVNSGRLVLQGVECDIDASGVTVSIDNIATKRYYTIYLEVNLGLNTATIKSEYDTATYPTIDSGDDLTENSTGIARLPLYQFTAQNGIISEVNKVVKSIKYINSNTVIDKANSLIFNGKGGINQVVFNTLTDFLNFVFSGTFNLSQAIKVEIIFSENFSYRIDRLSIKSTGEISYSQITNSFQSGRLYLFNVTSVIYGDYVKEITLSNIGDGYIKTLKVRSDSIFVTEKSFNLFRDQTVSSYQQFLFDFTPNNYSDKIDENSIEQIKLIYYIPQTDE